MDQVLLKLILEGMLFVAVKPMSKGECWSLLQAVVTANPLDPEKQKLADVKKTDVQMALEALSADYREAGRAIELQETASGWTMVTNVRWASWFQQGVPDSKSVRLSLAALETLAIIAYRQPVTRSEIEAIRGVAVDRVIQTLVERNLIQSPGRSEIAGRPLLYETTPFFMDHFGLKSLTDLPHPEHFQKEGAKKTRVLDREGPDVQELFCTTDL